MPLLGGIRPPIVLLCVLVLALAGLTAKVLRTAPREQVVPKAVLSSQQHFAEDGAVALRASIDERVTDLNRVAAGLNAGSRRSSRSASCPTWARHTRSGPAPLSWTWRAGNVLAARGETIPLAWLDKDVLTGERGPDAAYGAPGDRRRAPDDDGGAGLEGPAAAAADRVQQPVRARRQPWSRSAPWRSSRTGGEVLATAGFEQTEALNSDQERKELAFLQKQMTRLSAQAAEATEQDPVSAREPGSRGYPGVSGTLLGGNYNGRTATAGYASLASADPEEEQSVGAGLGLTVVALLPVVQQHADAAGRELYGLLAAGALVVLGLLAAAVLWATVQRPLLRLFLESRRLARGDLTRPVAVPRWGEARRIGSALEDLRTQLGGGGGDPAGTRPGKARLGVRGPVALTAVLLLLWCVPVGLLLNRTDDSVSVPASMVSDQRDRTDLVADRVRRALNEAQADLVSTSRLIDADADADADVSGDATRELLEEALREHSRYGALYVVDEDGGVVARAGDEPKADWSGDEDLPLVRVSGKGGKKPVIQAAAPVPDQKGRKGMVLVGEVRMEFLNSLLNRTGLGEVRVVDTEAQTIAASDGFLAFEKLPNDTLADLVAAAGVQVGAGPVENGLLIREGNGVTVAAAAPFAGGGVAADIGWTVVSWQPASQFEIARYQLENRTVLAGLLGLAAIVACLGWLHLVVVRPLRALAASAETLADGDLRTVLYPRYHDEVGAVTRSLELVRQQLQSRASRTQAAAARRRPARRRKELNRRALPLHRALVCGAVLLIGGRRGAAPALRQPRTASRLGCSSTASAASRSITRLCAGRCAAATWSPSPRRPARRRGSSTPTPPRSRSTGSSGSPTWWSRSASCAGPPRTDPDALVIECMAVMPALQEINQSKLIRSTIGVLCNVREDHLAEMGPTLDDVARSLCRSMPEDGICVTAERERFDILQEEADARNCQLIYADPETVTDDELRGLQLVHLQGERRDRAGRGRAARGGPGDRAAQGMYDAPPDPGVLSVERYRGARRQAAALRERLRGERPRVDADEHQPAARPRRDPPAAERRDQLPPGPRRAQRPDGRDHPGPATGQGLRHRPPGQERHRRDPCRVARPGGRPGRRPADGGGVHARAARPARPGLVAGRHRQHPRPGRGPPGAPGGTAGRRDAFPTDAGTAARAAATLPSQPDAPGPRRPDPMATTSASGHATQEIP